MTRPTKALIDLSALKHNLIRAASLSRGKIIAVIKSNAYGHSMPQVASCFDELAEVDSFAVAFSDEGIALREHLQKIGRHKNIITLEGFSDVVDLQSHLQHNLIATIHHTEQLKILGKEQLNKPLGIWLKHNSGMNRLGLSSTELLAAYQQISANPHLHLWGIMTHLAAANRANTEEAQEQVRVFHHAVTTIQQSIQQSTQQQGGVHRSGVHKGGAHRSGADNKPLPLSICNSAALCNLPAAHGTANDYERPGIMLYGASPLDNTSAQELDLRAGMQLKSKLISVRQLKAGDLVGYEGVWRCPADCLMGVAPIGYADGYPRRSAATPVPVLVNGHRCFLSGRVSMDMICLDLKNCPNAQVGDEVELWGANLPANEVADAFDTIVNRLFTGLTSRVPLNFI